MQNYKAPEGYLPLEEAVKTSGYSKSSLRQFAREGHIGKTIIHGRFYLSEEDLKKCIEKRNVQAPEGYLPLEEAVKISGRSASGLNYLAAKGNIKKIKENGRVYILTESLKSHHLTKKSPKKSAISPDTRKLIVALKYAFTQHSPPGGIPQAIKRELTDRGVTVTLENIIRETRNLSK